MGTKFSKDADNEHAATTTQDHQRERRDRGGGGRAARVVRTGRVRAVRERSGRARRGSVRRESVERSGAGTSAAAQRTRSSENDDSDGGAKLVADEVGKDEMSNSNPGPPLYQISRPLLSGLLPPHPPPSEHDGSRVTLEQRAGPSPRQLLNALRQQELDMVGARLRRRGLGPPETREGSPRAAAEPVMANEPEYECVSCYEKKPARKIATVPCQHRYCQQCLGSLFTSAANYQTPYPPRCCHLHILLAEYRHYLSVEVRLLCDTREYRDHTRRVGGYCHDPKCAAMIPQTSRRGNVGHCLKCDLETCLACMEAAHEGPCAQDAPLQKVLNLGKKSGWHRCQGCGNLIELWEGCHRMTCNCGFEFCYACGEGELSCKCRLVRNDDYLRRRFPGDAATLSDDEWPASVMGFFEEEREQEREQRREQRRLRYTSDRPGEDEVDDKHKKEEDEGEDEGEGEDEEWLRNYFRSPNVRQIPRGRKPPNPPRS